MLCCLVFAAHKISARRSYPAAYLFSFHALANSFVLARITTLLFSIDSGLIAQNTQGGGTPSPTPFSPLHGARNTVHGPRSFSQFSAFCAPRFSIFAFRFSVSPFVLPPHRSIASAYLLCLPLLQKTAGVYPILPKTEHAGSCRYGTFRALSEWNIPAPVVSSPTMDLRPFISSVTIHESPSAHGCFCASAKEGRFNTSQSSKLATTSSALFGRCAALEAAKGFCFFVVRNYREGKNPE